MNIETETPTCGKCENFDLKRMNGEPVGTLKLDDKQGGILEVRQGLCRALGGLSLGIRAEVMRCSNNPSRNIPASITEVHPEKVPA